MNDKVLELANKVLEQLFSDMETNGELQKTLSKLISDIVQTTVAYTISETLEFIKEHPEVLDETD